LPCRALLLGPSGIGGLLGFRPHCAHFTGAERLQLARLGAALGVVALTDRGHDDRASQSCSGRSAKPRREGPAQVPIETGVLSKRDFTLGFKVKTSQVKFTWTCLERRERSVGTRHTSVSNHNEVTRGLSQSISGLARISTCSMRGSTFVARRSSPFRICARSETVHSDNDDRHHYKCTNWNTFSPFYVSSGAVNRLGGARQSAATSRPCFGPK
jgi:hypothetical protein